MSSRRLTNFSNKIQCICYKCNPFHTLKMESSQLWQTQSHPPFTNPIRALIYRSNPVLLLQIQSSRPFAHPTLPIFQNTLNLQTLRICSHYVTRYLDRKIQQISLSCFTAFRNGIHRNFHLKKKIPFFTWDFEQYNVHEQHSFHFDLFNLSIQTIGWTWV